MDINQPVTNNQPSENPDRGADPAVMAMLTEMEQEGGRGFEYAKTRLSGYIRRAWQAAYTAKQHHEEVMLQCLRQRNGIYDPDIAALIQEQGGSDIYLNITQVKCRALESWIADILFQPGEAPFSIDPSPRSELPPELMQLLRQGVELELQAALQAGIIPTEEEVILRSKQVIRQAQENVNNQAKEMSEGMQEYIEDIFERANWRDEMLDFVSDLATYPTAFMRGPIKAKNLTMKWVEDQFGQSIPREQYEIQRTFRRVSPFDIYPSPEATCMQDGYLFHKMRLRRGDLWEMLGLPGYDDDAIRDAIDRYGDHGYQLVAGRDDERDHLEGRRNDEYTVDHPIDALSFWGPVRGADLLEWGLTPQMVPDRWRDYECNVIMVGDIIIRAAINTHPLKRRPFFMASYERVNGQIWGRGVCQLVKPPQDMCNAAARALASNMALASGPMVEISVDRLAEGETVTEIEPWRQVQTTESRVGNGQSAPAIRYFQPDSNANELVQVFTFFNQQADEHSGIPPYTHGVNASGGTASTASGFAMLQDNTARGIKRCVMAIDRVTVEQVKFTWRDVMKYDRDIDHLKGDVEITARASTALINRERQALRRNELAQTMINPVYQQVIGPRGNLAMLRELFKSLDIPHQEILPSEEELMAQMMQAQQRQQEQLEQEMNAQRSMVQQPKKGPVTRPDGQKAGVFV